MMKIKKMEFVKRKCPILPGPFPIVMGNTGPTGPMGPKGEPGISPTFEIGKVTTGAPGTNAQVTLTKI